jgi:hypothetical protein
MPTTIAKKREKAYAYWLIVQHHLRHLYSGVVVNDLPPGAEAFFKLVQHDDGDYSENMDAEFVSVLADERRREEMRYPIDD